MCLTRAALGEPSAKARVRVRVRACGRLGLGLGLGLGCSFPLSEIGDTTKEIGDILFRGSPIFGKMKRGRRKRGGLSNILLGLFLVRRELDACGAGWLPCGLAHVNPPVIGVR